jgi:Zn-dependent protease
MLLSNFQLDTVVFLIVALVIAITFHELAHAWVANKLGDPTAKHLGRLTLNPLAHLDPMGTIMILLVGFGWGKPVPYNPARLTRGRFSEVLIAISGPISNLLLAFIFALPGRIYLIQHQALPTGQLYTFLAVMVTLNIFLAAFNLIPIPPLDGSKILYLILDSFNVRQETILRIEQVGPNVLLLLIFSDRLFSTDLLYRLLEPIIAVFQWIVGSSTLPF